MATIPYTINRTSNRLVYIVVWEGLNDGDDGTPFDVTTVPGAGSTDRSVQIVGTFGTSTVAFEGSNDGGANWVSLADPQGNAVEKTAASIEQILEYTRAVRPAVSGGTTADIDVYLIVKGAR